MKKVFITGGSGFIGSHLADTLLSRGDTVWVIDNFSTGRKDNLKPHSNLKVFEGSISDRTQTFALIKDFAPDVVVHAAASYKDPENWAEDSMTNVLGTANVVQACKEVKVPRLIYFQTALCYGLKPIEQPITLKHPLFPGGSSYAISKTAGEDYVRLSGLNYVSFRLANAYGPRNVSGPLPTFYKRLTENQKCIVAQTRRDFVYVSDMIRAVVKAVDGIGKGEYHLSSGSDVSIKDLYDATTQALGLKIEAEVKPRQEDDVASILLDPSKTAADFEWKTEIPLIKGVAQTISYYKEFGIKETFTHLKDFKK